jgi:hypothetical protein
MGVLKSRDHNLQFLVEKEDVYKSYEILYRIWLWVFSEDESL